MNLTKIMKANENYYVDKKRTTIYISQSIYRRFKKSLKKNRTKSVSMALENFMAEVIRENQWLLEKKTHEKEVRTNSRT